MGSNRDRDRALVVGKAANLTKMEDSIKKMEPFFEHLLSISCVDFILFFSHAFSP